MHLDEEQLQRVIHGELRPEVAAAVHGHLGGCPECRTRLEQAEREEAWVLERLTRVDHPPPRASVAAIIDRSTGRRRSRARLAAGLALALGAAGVAYAAPGSPLPAALDRLGDLIAPSRRSSPATTAPAPAVSQAGIAVDPGQRLTVSFQSGSITDTAFISLTNDAELVIRAVGGSAGFDSKTDRLLIRHTGPTNFEILIPRSAPLIEVRSGERRLLLKQGERLRAVVDPQGGGRYVIPLTPARGE